MSLLTQLDELDLSAIVAAREQITAVVSDPNLQRLLEQGPGASVLGDLGAQLQALTQGQGDSGALLAPLSEALAELAEPLRLGDVSITELAESVEEGTRIVAELTEGLDGTPESLLRLTRIDWDSRLGSVMSGADQFANVTLDRISRMQGVLQLAESGFEVEPQELAQWTATVVLPFQRGAVVELRQSVDRVLDHLGDVQLPQSRFDGLVAALQRVTRAAGESPEAVERALDDLQRVQSHTLAQVDQELAGVAGRLGELDLQAVLAPVREISQAFRTGQDGLLETLEQVRGYVRELRDKVESGLASDIEALIPQGLTFLDTMERHIRTEVVGLIDRKVEEMSERVRALFSHLRLRELRSELSKVFQEAADAVRDAELDRLARQAHEVLDELREAIASPDLSGEARGSLEAATDTIANAVDTIADALSNVGSAVEDVAEEAAGILEQVADLLESFQGVVDQIRQAIEQLGVEEATEQVIDEIEKLRKQAQELLSGTELPEPVRPLVEQLVKEIEDIDLEARLTQPLMDKLGNLQLPDELRSSILGTLEGVEHAIGNLIPREVVRSIEQELEQALEVLSQFDSERLVEEVNAFVAQAASAVERLDPGPGVAQLRRPFEEVLGVLDAAQPQRLLAPLIRAYDDAVGALPLPDPNETAVKAVDVVDKQADGVARRAVEPVRQLAGEAQLEVDPQREPEPPDMAQLLQDNRPGDMIRLLGFVPGKLREALTELDEGAAEEVRHTVDRLSRGLARDLRRLSASLTGMERQVQRRLDVLLKPVARAQLQAVHALQARAQLGPVQLEASLAVLGEAHPTSLRQALRPSLVTVGRRGRSACSAVTTQAGNTLQSAATRLEQSMLANATGSVEDLLAALDPEPIALEIDALAAAVLRRYPDLYQQVRVGLDELMQRVRRVFVDLNPLVLAQRFLKVIAVLREELDVLNPQRLADELELIHRAMRQTLQAYDPQNFVADVQALVSEVAGQLRSLEAGALLGDLSGLDAALARLREAVPSEALGDVGASLSGVSDRFEAIDLQQLVEAVESLGPRLTEEFQRAVDSIRDELVTLLESLRYAGGSAQASAEVG